MTQTAKIDRKLYVGNLPTSMTQRMLTDVMNDAMLNLNKTKGWKLEPGPPVVSSWISTDGHYGFIEFRTAEEAHLGFALQGMSYLGSELKIGRPKAYQDADAEDNSMVLPPMSLEEFNPILAATQAFPIQLSEEAQFKSSFPLMGPQRSCNSKTWLRSS